jgi:hypothetical protein
MKATIDIPDEILCQAGMSEIEEGVSLQALVVRYVEEGLARSTMSNGEGQGQQRKRSNLPVARPATGKTIPQLTNRQLHDMVDSEDAESLRIRGE